MDPEKKKEWVRTALIAAGFLILALVLLNMMIGDPGAMPEPPRP